MKPRIIGVNTNSYHGFGIEDALDGIAAAGFRHVELTATKGWTEHVFPNHSFSSLVAVKDMMKDRGLRAFALSGHCNLTDPERLRDFRENMELANYFGCPYIVSSVGDAHFGSEAEGGTERIADKLRSLVEDLRRLGLTLALETHGAHSTGAALKAIVDAVASPLIRINYDTANVVYYGGVDPCEDIKTCLDDICFLHGKDKAGAKDAWNFPALGEGYIDFPTLFATLDAADNAAPVSIEIEFTSAGPSSLEEVNRAILRSRDYLLSLGYRPLE